jgi:hypothetical protein
VAHHREALHRVERRGALPGGGVDDQLTGRLPRRQRVHEGLDAARARREVVGDDQRPHPRRPLPLARQGDPLRGARVRGEQPDRDRVRVEVGQVRPGQALLRLDERPWVAGELERVHVGPCLDLARHQVAHRSGQQGADGDERHQQRDHPRVAGAGGPDRPSSRRHETSRNSAQTAAAAPSAPSSVPTTTSRSAACPSSWATTSSTSAGVACSSSVS